MHHHGKQQPEGIGEDVTFDPLDLLARVKADRIDQRPPFCTDLALSLSMIAADGLASRPSLSRNTT
jgi:hypothetical protein